MLFVKSRYLRDSSSNSAGLHASVEPRFSFEIHGIRMVST